MKNKYQPDPALVDLFNQLEGKIDAARQLIEKLRQENENLRQRLAEMGRAHREALVKIDNILDRIDGLL